MTRFASDAVLDGSLTIVKTLCNKMVACSAAPTNYTEAVTTYALADVTMASGDYTIANGDTDGRKCTVAAKTAVTVDANGDATHVALVETGTTTLHIVTPLSATVSVTTSGTVDFASFKINARDPVAP